MKTFALTRSRIIELVLGLCLVFAVACVAFLSGTWEPAHAEPGSAATYGGGPSTSNTKASPSPSSKSSTPTSNTKASPSPSFGNTSNTSNTSNTKASPSPSFGNTSNTSNTSNTKASPSPSSKASSPSPSTGGRYVPPSSNSSKSNTPTSNTKASPSTGYSTPGSYGTPFSGGAAPGSSITYGAGTPGQLTIYSGADLQIFSTFTILNIRTAAGGGRVGTLRDNTIVGYSTTLSAQNGYDTWIASVPIASSDSNSSSGKSGGSGSGGGGSSSSGGSSQPAGSTGGTPWGGYWEQQQSCTSSGKGGRSCSSAWVWIADPVSQTSSPCETATCSGQGEPLSGGSGEGAASQLPIWIDAVPRLVRTGSSSALEWGSTDAESCIIKLSGNAVFTGTSGQGAVDDITEQRTYVLQCDMEAGNILTSSVTISIIPVWREF